MQTALQEQTRIHTWEQFDDFARLIVAQTHRRQGTLSLLVVALDTPPLIQDAEQWHKRASDALAAVLEESVRFGDMLAHHGRDSFALLGADTGAADAVRLASRIRARLQHSALMGASLFDWVSIGIATQPEAGTAFRDLLRHAETAVAEAKAGAGGRVKLFGWDGSIQHLVWDQERDLVDARRRAAQTRLMEAVRRGQIKGIGIRTQAGACPTCQAAARDVYRHDLLPMLPLIGCSTSTGCRCSFSSPALQGTSALVPVPLAESRSLDIPGKLRDAALFGSDPRRRCKPADLAEYLESFPFLWFESDLDLEEGERLYLKRRADYAWERMTAASTTVHGPRVPYETPLPDWLSEIGKPPTLPRNALLGGESGTLYLTNRRLLFQSGTGIEAISLLQVADLEYLRDGFACRGDDWQNRLVFLVDDSLPVSLYLARAIRAAVFQH